MDRLIQNIMDFVRSINGYMEKNQPWKLVKEDKELATQVLFWARAARIGSGERKTFHTILSEIGKISPEFISDNAKTISELGYWKDLVPYFHIPKVISIFAQAIREKDRLACKWAPRKCAVLRDSKLDSSTFPLF